MKRFSLVFIFIVATMIFISGCEDGNTATTTVNPFRGGTDSLSIVFDQGYPPSEVYAGPDYPFSIILRVKNEGEYDVSKDEFEVSLQGLKPESFGMNINDFSKKANFDLIAKKKTSQGSVIDTPEDYIEFANLAYQDSNLAVTIPNQPIQARACYEYGTTAISSICIKRDPTKDNPDDVCKVAETKQLYVSSGPVQIQNLQQSPRSRDSIAFTFDVVHSGAGKVFKLNSDCGETGGERADSNKVAVEVIADVAGLTCAGIVNGEVNLGDAGRRTINCNLDISAATSDYPEQIEIRTKYDYEQILSTTMTVKSSLE